ncbi:hypothetical protein D1007_62318 [Hordeum vulgare]|nr:hypothetical protein D1007_62318 [Hordeum vulgare]KAI4966879.1 hypothetical protein ZWY2020_035759 [Hordeum vulgare]KAI5013157.1 hypothetical protein ZWY2020_028111 [Hordeum vulgare]
MIYDDKQPAFSPGKGKSKVVVQPRRASSRTRMPTPIIPRHAREGSSIGSPLLAPPSQLGTDREPVVAPTLLQDVMANFFQGAKKTLPTPPRADTMAIKLDRVIVAKIDKALDINENKGGTKIVADR